MLVTVDYLVIELEMQPGPESGFFSGTGPGCLVRVRVRVEIVGRVRVWSGFKFWSGFYPGPGFQKLTGSGFGPGKDQTPLHLHHFL